MTMIHMKRAIWVALIPIAAYLYYQIQFPGGEAAHLSHYALQFTLLLFATLSLAAAALRERRKEVSTLWFRLAAGLGIWALATVMESAEVLLEQPRFGTVADGSWVAGYAVVLAAMFAGTNSLHGWTSRRSVYAGGLWLAIGFAAGLVSLFHEMPKIDRQLVLLLGCLYYLSDVLLVFLAVICVFSNAPADLEIPLRLVLVSFILFYVFDLIVILQDITSPLDQWSGVGYVVGYFLMYRAGIPLRDTSVAER